MKKINVLYQQCKSYFQRRYAPKTFEELVSKYGFGSCFRLFPPSYYRKYSPEKLSKMKETELATLRAMLEEYEKRITDNKE